MGADLLLQRAGDPEGLDLQRVGDDDDPRLARGRSASRSRARPAITSRSVGRVIGIRDRSRQHDVSVLIRNGSGSIRETSRSVVRSAKPTPTMLPWLSSETSRTHEARDHGTVEVGLGLDYRAGR